MVAKLTVVLVWFAILLGWFILEGLLVGGWMRLPGLTMPLAVSLSAQIVLAGLIGYLLVPVVAWIATLGRGYLPPIGFTIFMLVLGN